MYLFSHQTRLKYFLLAMPCDETIFFFLNGEIQMQIQYWPLLEFNCQCMRVCAKTLQLCPTLCDPMDHSPPGSSVRGIL